VVAAFQSGRFFAGGGASAIGFATSTDAGKTWNSGFLPGLTLATGGPATRATDPSVAHDPLHGVWLVASLTLTAPFAPSPTSQYVISRSTNGGLTWSPPVVASPANPAPPPALAHDKGWIVCDTWAASPFFGRCYLAYSDFVNGRISIVRSTDGGVTWSAPVGSADSAGGLGVQPVVQPSGHVVIPYLTGTGMRSIRSTNGGVTFEASVSIAGVTAHTPTGMRSLPIPSVEVDGGGVVYVAWQDCRFRAGCISPTFAAPNDIVYATSNNGISWSSVRRIPIDRTTSGVDHFIPGLGVDTATQGADANIGVAYYYFPNAFCSVSTCELHVGFVSSRNGGARWRHARRLGGPMLLSWIADTLFAPSGGRMVGDYISTSFVAGSSVAVPVFSLASPPSGSTFHQATWASRLRVESR
jgi:hypothetical protein